MHQRITQRVHKHSQTARDKDNTVKPQRISLLLLRSTWVSTDSNEQRQQSSLQPRCDLWSCCPPLLLPASVLPPDVLPAVRHHHWDRTETSDCQASSSALFPAVVPEPNLGLHPTNQRLVPGTAHAGRAAPVCKNSSETHIIGKTPWYRHWGPPEPRHSKSDQPESPGCSRRALTWSPSISACSWRLLRVPEVGCP